MPLKGLRRTLEHLCKTLIPERPDEELLRAFLAGADEGAFAVLVRRHGPMVLGVARRILGNLHDSQDVFQATFLVLAQKARSVVKQGAVASWLYKVAYRIALKARARNARRCRTEKQAAMLHPRKSTPEVQDWEAILDEELCRLPEKYRLPIVLCDLEAHTRKEVESRLGLAGGTLSSRLARARRMLAARLSRRGIVLSAGALSRAMTQTARSAVPPGLAGTTVTAARLVAAGQTANLSSSITVLMKAGVKAMFLTKLKTALATVLILAFVGGGIVYSGGSQGPPAKEPDPAARHKELMKLKQQLQQMQEKITRLEREIQPPACDTAFLAKHFKYRVPFEIGATESSQGGRIEIREVWGTRPRIEVGGQYLVRGKYVLPPGQRGKIYFFTTAGGQWGGIGTTLDLQTMAVDKQQGEFALVHGMLGTGYFHLVLADPERYSRMFANVYFGTGDNVLREINWRPKAP